MTPRVDIESLSIDDDPETTRERVRKSRWRELPVHGRDLDDIRGVLYARDLFLKPLALTTELIKPANFVPEQIKLVQLLRHFRHEGIRLAIVVDEYGGTTGLVSMRDVLERIVGNLNEYDAPPPAVTTEQIDENTYYLSGDLSVRVWADRFGVGEIDRRIDTLGGLVLAKLGRIPHPGDSVRIRNLTITVDRMSNRRIERLVLRRDPNPQPGWEGAA